MLASQVAFSLLYSFLYGVGGQLVSAPACIEAVLLALLVTVGTLAD